MDDQLQLPTFDGVTVAEMLIECEREIEMRERLYPKWNERDGKNKQRDLALKRLRALLQYMRWTLANRDAILKCKQEVCP